MSMSFNLITLFGIPVRIHISLVALLGIVGITGWHLEGFEGVFWNLSLLTAIFGSIVLHELAHSLVAVRKGCRVREITLLFIGGAAQMEEIPRKPADEIQMAAAGPLFSIVLGSLAWFGGPWVPLPANMPSLAGQHPLNLIQLAGQINFSLALFNLLPAFPMDGGRIFRALMSRKIGFLPATFVASRLGRVAAIIMGIVGFRNGWWGLMIIAVFLFRAAGREFDYVLQQELKDGLQSLASWALGGVPSVPSVKEIDDQVKVSPPPYKRGHP
jgi:Zn-dependent protease